MSVRLFHLAEDAVRPSLRRELGGYCCGSECIKCMSIPSAPPAVQIGMVNFRAVATFLPAIADKANVIIDEGIGTKDAKEGKTVVLLRGPKI